MKHFFRILFGVAVIAGICYGLNTLREKKLSEPEPEIIRPVRSIKLTDGNKIFRRKYFGTVQGGKRAALSFRVSGTLNKIYVDNGENVKKGQILAALDPRDFNTKISQAKSVLSQAQAQYKNSQTDFKRYEHLYQQRVIAKAQYDTSKTQLDVAKSAVNSANANLKAARDSLKDTELRAPFDGIIADRTVENFQDVTAKQTIFTLQDLSTLEIVFNIPDNDILTAPMPSFSNLGELLHSSANLFTINARFEAVPEHLFPLELKEVATQATSSNTYPVTATMSAKKDFRILPGMAATVEVDFKGDNKPDMQAKYLVPTTAILNSDGKNFVWRYENGKATKHSVKTGLLRENAMIEITSEALNDGDIILTAGVNFLREGQKVRLQGE